MPNAAIVSANNRWVKGVCTLRKPASWLRRALPANTSKRGTGTSRDPRKFQARGPPGPHRSYLGPYFGRRRTWPLAAVQCRHRRTVAHFQGKWDTRFTGAPPCLEQRNDQEQGEGQLTAAGPGEPGAVALNLIVLTSVAG